MNEINELSSDIKKNLLKALLKGDINKDDLNNPKDIIRLCNDHKSLIWIKMGDIESIKFEGKDISKEEYNRLSKLAEVLGLPMLSAHAKFNIEVVPSPYNIPLANSEDQIQMD